MVTVDDKGHPTRQRTICDGQPSAYQTATALSNDLDRDRADSWMVICVETKRPGLTLVAGHRLTSEGDGAVKVVLAVEQRGALGRILSPLTSRFARRNVQMEAEGLKQRSEAG